jgi:hypothetical protein
VIVTPIIHTTDVFVTFNKDRVKASNSLVILTPFRLKTAIVVIPATKRTIKTQFEKSYDKKISGLSINASSSLL